MMTHQMDVTRACGLIGISRLLYRYEAKRPADQELKERLCELAAQKRRYGDRRLHVLLCREGWEINRKRTYRVYHEAGLMVRKRKPQQNAYIESFNGKFRDECLNEHWFVSMRHARQVIEDWRQEYNAQRPHSSLGYLTPKQFADSFLTADSVLVAD